MNWDLLFDRFELLNRRAAIIGPHGTGKTTFLNGFERRLVDRDWSVRRVQLRVGQRRDVMAQIGSVDERTIVLLDSAGVLPVWSWPWLKWRLRRVGGLVITAHQRTNLPTLLETAANATIFTRLVEDLAPEWSNALRPQLPAMIERQDGNLREVLRELYDVVGAQAAPTTPRRRPGRETREAALPS